MLKHFFFGCFNQIILCYSAEQYRMMGHWGNLQVPFRTPISAEIKNDKFDLLGLEIKIEVF